MPSPVGLVGMKSPEGCRAWQPSDVVGSHFHRIELICVLYVGDGYVVDCSRYPREPSRGGAAR